MLNPLIIISKKDQAGINISKFLSKSLKVHFVESESVYAEDIDKKFPENDLIIFASKHQGSTPRMLSLHAPGNPSSNDFGGEKNTLCLTSGTILKTFFRELNENTPEGWNTTLECTHHGPNIESTPCLFIEIGSSKDDWEKTEAGKAIATTIENALILIKDKLENNLEYQTAIALGGPHYCPNFNKIQLSPDLAISHIIPEYQSPITETMIQEAINKTQEKVTTAIIDWKGLGKSEDRQKVIDILEQLNLNIIRTSEI
ncbi:MAG: hypothetical protein KKF56_01820 [Nanoarchaeota archaeon]|nr:hypothetical protein [Nanoarchaeota archaeon]